MVSRLARHPIETRILTSTKMSLWSRTPFRMLDKVIPTMMIKAPIMKPCDHASSVICAGLVGLSECDVMFTLLLPWKGAGVKCRKISWRTGQTETAGKMGPK